MPINPASYRNHMNFPSQRNEASRSPMLDREYSCPLSLKSLGPDDSVLWLPSSQTSADNCWRYQHGGREINLKPFKRADLETWLRSAHTPTDPISRAPIDNFTLIMLTSAGDWSDPQEVSLAMLIYHSGYHELIVDIGEYRGYLENGLRNGHGIVTYLNGDKYDGEWKDNLRNGHGIIISSESDGPKYDGEWKDDLRNGHGILIFADGRKYEGEWKDDLYHGHGSWTHADGSKYEGEYKDGSRNGHGSMTYANGIKYEGEWKDGRWDGHGSWSGADGSKYEGEFKDGVRNGHGSMTYANGDKYEGEWKNGYQHGQGTQTFSDGREYRGKWKDGQWHGEGVFFERGEKYEGEWQYGKKRGWGIQKFQNNSRYVGCWEDGRQNGRGVFTFSDGTKYYGYFKNDRFNGKGVHVYQDGSKYEGQWINGERDGEGIETDRDGQKYSCVYLSGVLQSRIPKNKDSSGIPNYVGQTKNGKKHGKGTYTDPVSGSTYDGDWVDDKQHGEGIETYKSGVTFRGTFVEGRKTYGAITYSDSSTYKGDIVFNKKHGDGVLKDSAGQIRYEGQWKNGVKSGWGVEISESGERYEGTFEDGDLKKGTIYYRSGLIFKGGIVDFKRHGEGSLIYDNGAKFEGSWENDKRNGEGTVKFPFNAEYKGTWRNDEEQTLEDNSIIIEDKKYTARFSSYFQHFPSNIESSLYHEETLENHFTIESATTIERIYFRRPLYEVLQFVDYIRDPSYLLDHHGYHYPNRLKAYTI